MQSSAQEELLNRGQGDPSNPLCAKNPPLRACRGGNLAAGVPGAVWEHLWKCRTVPELLPDQIRPCGICSLRTFSTLCVELLKTRLRLWIQFCRLLLHTGGTFLHWSSWAERLNRNLSISSTPSHFILHSVVGASFIGSLYRQGEETERPAMPADELGEQHRPGVWPRSMGSNVGGSGSGYRATSTFALSSLSGIWWLAAPWRGAVSTDWRYFWVSCQTHTSSMCVIWCCYHPCRTLTHHQ